MEFIYDKTIDFSIPHKKTLEFECLQTYNKTLRERRKLHITILLIVVLYTKLLKRSKAISNLVYILYILESNAYTDP